MQGLDLFNLLHPSVRNALKDMDIMAFFPVQTAVLSHLLHRRSGLEHMDAWWASKRDVCVCAPTGQLTALYTEPACR